MSPRAKRLSGKALIKLLEQAGFDHVSTRGDHYKMRRAGRTVVVPLGRDPLRIGTQKSILAEAGLDEDDLP